MFEGATHLFCPSVEATENGQFRFSPEINRSRLRQSILFFDNVLYVPYAASFMVTSFSLVDPEVHLLLEQGIVSRVGDRRVHIAKLNKEFFDADAETLFIALNKNYPDQRYISSVPISKPADKDSANAIYCRVRDALPVPSSKASISDIVAFRIANRQKLLRLGNHFERLGLILGGNFEQIEKVVFDLEEDLNRLGDSLDAAGLYGGKADVSFSRSLGAGFSKIVSAALASVFGINEIASSMIASSVQISFSKGPVVEGSNSFPRAFEFLVDAGRQRIFSGSKRIGEVHDWMQNESNDAQNTVRLAMPPEGAPPRMLPKGATIRDNIMG